jgi:hypothetical protein
MVISYSHPTRNWLIVVFKERTELAGSEHGFPFGEEGACFWFCPRCCFFRFESDLAPDSNGEGKIRKGRKPLMKILLE